MQEPVQKIHAETDDWLSALFDGETNDRESARVIDQVARDEALRTRWTEYCLIGDAMRGLAKPDGLVPERVRSALSQEPTVLAPAVKPARPQPVLWLAAAATVAAVTWMVLNSAPTDQVPIQVAGTAVPSQAVDVSPYLVVHQDYAQALTSAPEMHFSQVALSVPESVR